MVKKLKIDINSETMDIVSSEQLTLLQYLRQNGLTGTKEGCASGDCGACTVLLCDKEAEAPFITVNSCITPLLQLTGKQVITVEGLTAGPRLHVVQQQLIEKHGSQCGFCTPGFVMSLAAWLENRSCEQGAMIQAPAQALRAEVVEAISGNLCRCTGYKPIIEAGMAAALEIAETGSRFQSLASLTGDIPGQMDAEQSVSVAAGEGVKKAPIMMRPGSLQELDAGLMRWPQARLCAGGTDLLLEKTQQGKPLDCLLSCLEVKEMNACSISEKALLIGAAASYSVIEQFCQSIWPDLGQFLKRFGSPQIRNRATLGGNLATASPVGDMSPLLMVMNASVILRSAQGVERSIAVGEFFKGYRQTVLNDGEYIRAVSIGLEAFNGFRRFFKNSKRTMDDISTVMGAFYLDVSSSRVREARIAYGGLAAMPIRVKAVEDFLVGKELNQASISRAQALLKEVINPLSDVRASADYRSHIAASMLSRALREQSGEILPAVTVG